VFLRRGFPGVGAVVAVLGLAVAGCGSSSSTVKNQATGGTHSLASLYTGWPSGGTPKAGGTAVVDVGEGATSLSPTSALTQGNIGPEMAIFDQLTELMPGSGTETVLEPGLASSWTVSKDERTYTFHIRPGVKFSNGEPLTAEDVAFSLKLDSSPSASGYAATRDWKQVSVAGPMTVILTLKKPESSTLETLNIPEFSIMPKRVVQRDGAEKFGLHPIGTGAFMLESATPGFTTINLARNPGYWRKGLPYLNGLVFNQVESANSRILAVRSGAADIAQQIPYAQVAALRGTPEVKMLIGPEWGASFVVFNRRKAPFDNVNVRKALLYATPREEIIKSVYDGLGTGANSLLGQLKYWSASVPAYPYDLAKARELLKSSPVPNGFHMNLSVTGGEAEGQELAAILQSSYEKIGVHVTIQSLEATSLSSDFYGGKTEAAALPPETGWATGYEPNFQASFYMNNIEPGGFSPPAGHKLVSEVEKASTTTSPTEKEKLFKEIQYQALWGEALYLPIVNLVSLNAARDNVRGLQVLPNITVRWERLWLQ
jgi:peptide/nickel transport system substrate-binding protein